MFTGIVQTCGRVAALQDQPSGKRLVVDPLGWRPAGASLALGDSICVSGVCLTLAGLDQGLLAFDVIAETLALTTLGALGTGSNVNIEPSLTPATPIGGHFMQGHVDGVGTVSRLQASPQEWRIGITPPAELMDYIIPKGSVAIEGVSLTLAAVGRLDFEVALIPTTLRLTNLGQLKVGNRVNLEADILAKTIVHFMRRQTAAGGGLTMDALRKAGFAGPG